MLDTTTATLPAKMPEWKCKRCGHRWTARQLEKPKACGRCKSYYWDREPRKRKRVFHKPAKNRTAVSS